MFRLPKSFRFPFGPSIRGDGPKIASVCISMVKNEQDVIEPFLRHNHRFFDLMVLLDNGSADATRRIAFDCAREFGNIVVSDQPDAAYRQSEFMTAAMHWIQGAVFADFVCFLDADEFVTAPDRETFLTKLSQVPVGVFASLPWQTYLPGPEEHQSGDDGPGDALIKITWRRRREEPVYSKAFHRLGGRIDPTLVVAQGNHAVTAPGYGSIGHRAIPGLALMHLPVRNIDQILAKGVIGWAANLAHDPHAERSRIAAQWRRIAELAGKPIEDAAAFLSQEAMVYAQTAEPGAWPDNAEQCDPGIDLTRRHSEGRSMPWRDLVAACRNSKPAQVTEEQFEPRQPVAASSDIANAFDTEWHWNNFYFDIPPFRYLAEKYAPASVLDIGCGTGTYVDLFRSLGIRDSMGWDGMPASATILDAANFERRDLQLAQDAGRQFDLVLCLEVVEHIRPEDTGILLDTIARHARELIVFSMAEPDQPGNGHINCRSKEEVLALWRARGWVPDLGETLGLRALSSLQWFRRNLLVLKREGSFASAKEADRASAILIDTARVPIRWYRQTPGVRRYPFKEPYPQRRLFGGGSDPA